MSDDREDSPGATDRVRLEPIRWTDRELQVLREVVPELTERDIAAKLALYGLTDRELQIVREIVLGFTYTAAKLKLYGTTNREIAAKLGISEGAVMRHLVSIFDKTGVSGRFAVLKLFLELI